MDSRLSQDRQITPLERHRPRRHWLRQIVLALIGIFFVMPAVFLLLFRFVPIPATPQMVISLLQGDGARYRWVELDQMAPALGRAVIASEDSRFCSHYGFDWNSIDKAMRAHERGARLRGASTISQQAARSLFLLPVRSWIRKGMEAYLTVMMESLWPKRRILAAYLNLVDWGHGNFGAEAAAQDYFHRSVFDLTDGEAARLATILPDPDQWRASRPGPYVARRAMTILARAGEVRRDGLDSCIRR